MLQRVYRRGEMSAKPEKTQCDLCKGEGQVKALKPGWPTDCPRCDGKGDLFRVGHKLVCLNEYLLWKTQKHTSP